MEFAKITLHILRSFSMKIYTSISDVKSSEIEEDIKELLLLLEKVNSCGQQYYSCDKTLAVTYLHKLNIFNFKKGLKLELPVRIVAMPISMEMSSVFGDEANLDKILKSISGLSLVLNSDKPITKRERTLSNFMLYNKFNTFEDYMSSLRSSYRRRLNLAIEKGKDLRITRLEPEAFTLNHYKLYEDVYKRSDNKLELLPIEFFREFRSEMYEFKNAENEVLAFVQLLERNNQLLFIFCGFKEEDVKTYDIYYNMLLFIVNQGISRGVYSINFGQTSEESKSKIGCIEIPKYLYLHHNNPAIRGILKILTPYFSYKGYSKYHRVFKVNQ